MALPDWLSGIGLSDLLDIAIIGFIIYLILVFIKKTRAAFVLVGILIASVVYLIARQFGLVLTATVLQAFFAVILIALVVIFREELRNLFEQIAVWSLNRRLPLKKKSVKLLRDEVETLVTSLADLAKEKIGALVVIRGKDMISGYLDGGVDLGGKLSEPLLKSIFDPSSIGHDGALVIEHDKIDQFGAHLPLSKNTKGMSHKGTRHAAALGLAEVSDALCLVVSEERGTISVARNGKIGHVKDVAELTQALDKFYEEVAPQVPKKPLQEIFQRNFREKIMAAGLAVLLWFVTVYGQEVVYQTYRLPVEHPKLTKGLEVTEMTPRTVNATFSAPRHHFYFLGPKAIRMWVDGLDTDKKGKQEITISRADLKFPQTLTLRDVDVDEIFFRIDEVKDEG